MLLHHGLSSAAFVSVDADDRLNIYIFVLDRRISRETPALEDTLNAALMWYCRDIAPWMPTRDIRTAAPLFMFFSLTKLI